jgi:UDP-glucose 4-epimerase
MACDRLPIGSAAKDSACASGAWILVTGGAGYVGSHAVLELLDSGFRVVVLDSLVTGFRWAVDPRAIFVEGCVEDEALVRKLLHDHEICGILHFAGSTIAPESVRNPLKYYRNNTLASQSLLESAVAQQVRHFVFSSTAAVYDPSGLDLVSEDCAPRPATPYGWSKLMTERMLEDAARSYPFNYCSLRYFNVAGADPLGRTGPSGASSTHLVKVAVEAALGKRPEVTVYGNNFGTPDGTGVRDYIHVSDLARAHVLALNELFASPGSSHVLNCGYGRGHSVLEVLDMVGQVAGRPIPHVFGPRRPGDLDRVVADNRRLKECLRWRPQYDSLHAIVTDALRWEEHLSRSTTQNITG